MLLQFASAKNLQITVQTLLNVNCELFTGSTAVVAQFTLFVSKIIKNENRIAGIEI
jgi:hypothetical protein